MINPIPILLAVSIPCLAIPKDKQLHHDRKQPGNRFDPADCGATVAGGVVVTYAIRW